MFTSAPILVCGDVMADKYLDGVTERISPEAPVPIVNITGETTKPGGASNVAMNIAALNGSVSLAGIVGVDGTARELRKLLRGNNVGLVGLSSRNTPTNVKYRVVSQHQQLMRLDVEPHIDKRTVEHFTQSVVDLLPDYKCVVFSDYGKGSLQRVQRLIKAASALSLPTVVDPKGECFEKYAGATVITPNLKEFKRVVGSVNSELTIEKKAVELCRDIDLKYVLLTRSEKGLSLYDKTGLVIHSNATAEEVFDVTGAGDTVVANIALALISGIPMTVACDIANIAAGEVVKKFGTSTVSLSELSEKVPQHLLEETLSA